MAEKQPSVLYISYDAAASPLGQSQVLAYLERLARSFKITLLSYETSDEAARRVEDRVEAAGIRWLPLRYHKNPLVISTAWDVARGTAAVLREARRRPPDIIHCRSYVPVLVAMASRRKTGASLLFDIRGFWVDERIEGGLWRPNGVLYRTGKWWERRFFDAADGIVTLTEASLPQIREWLNGREVPVEVIPTCADVDSFASSNGREAGGHAVWCGSVGTWYRFDLAVRLAMALRMPFKVLTRYTADAMEELDGYEADVRTVKPEQIPEELSPGNVGLCLYKSSFSRLATAPTRFAEYLSAGMPVAVTPGLGDVEEVVEKNGVGVVVRSEDDEALEGYANELRRLAANPEVADRCRAIARRRYRVESGVGAYERLYRRLASSV